MARTMKLGLVVALLCFASASRAYGYSVSTWPPICSGPIGYYEARVYTGTSRGGTCYSLQMSIFYDVWSSWDATTGFPNDDIESAEAGPLTYLVLFWNGFYTSDNGATKNIGPNQYVSDLGSWKNKASAARVQLFTPGACASTGKVNFFTDANYGGDCTVLTTNHSYDNPAQMGFRNDTLTSIKNLDSGSQDACLSLNAGLGYPLRRVSSQTSDPNLGNSGFNDCTSSVLISEQCWRQ